MNEPSRRPTGDVHWAAAQARASMALEGHEISAPGNDAARAKVAAMIKSGEADELLAKMEERYPSERRVALAAHSGFGCVEIPCQTGDARFRAVVQRGGQDDPVLVVSSVGDSAPAEARFTCVIAGDRVEIELHEGEGSVAVPGLDLASFDAWLDEVKCPA